MVIYDAVRNKYFTLGLIAFKLIGIGVVERTLLTLKKINAEGVETTGDEIKSFLNFLQQNNLIVQPAGQMFLI